MGLSYAGKLTDPGLIDEEDGASKTPNSNSRVLRQDSM